MVRRARRRAGGVERVSWRIPERFSGAEPRVYATHPGCYSSRAVQTYKEGSHESISRDAVDRHGARGCSGVLGWGYNTELLAKKKLPEPKCWKDLANPAYKDEIQMANPG